MNKKMLIGILSVILVCDMVQYVCIKKVDEQLKIKNAEVVKLQDDVKAKDLKIQEITDSIKKNEEVIAEKEAKIKEQEDMIAEKEKEIKAKKEYPTQPKVRSIEKGVTNVSNKREINVELTAYCNCSICSDNWGSKTAMGTHNRVGVIAMPKEIPLGTKVEIPSLSWYKSDYTFDVEDRGGAIKKKSNGTYIVDVWFSSHSEAMKFGRQKTKAYILK